MLINVVIVSMAENTINGVVINVKKRININQQWRRNQKK
jgi:hypothetical protein